MLCGVASRRVTCPALPGRPGRPGRLTLVHEVSGCHCGTVFQQLHGMLHMGGRKDKQSFQAIFHAQSGADWSGGLKGWRRPPLLTPGLAHEGLGRKEEGPHCGEVEAKRHLY